MTDKAYIVTNEAQEREVLEKLEREGLVWFDGGEKPTEWIPSQKGTKGAEFPYVLLDDGEISWKFLNDLSDEEIAFDGRKESKMKISKEVYDALVEWRKNKNLINELVWYTDIKSIPEVVKEWWAEDFVNKTKTNNRLIAIIRWVNGEDVFEVEKPKKWVVRSKEPQGSVDGEPLYIWFVDELTLETETEATMPPYIRRFNTKEEAQSWANAHQEVVEVEE